VQVLLQRGSFDARSTELTSTALRVYSLGMVAMALNRVMPVAYQARQNTTIPMQAGLVRIAASIVVCALLVPRIGHVGVALAVVISEYMKLVLLIARLKTPVFQGRVMNALPRLVAAVAVMAAAVIPAMGLLSGSLHWGLRDALSLLGVVCLGVACYGTALFAFFREDFVYYARRLLGALPPPLMWRGIEGRSTAG